MTQDITKSKEELAAELQQLRRQNNDLKQQLNELKISEQLPPEALQQYKTQLQALVEERTHQIETTNHRLQAEILEHKRTEQTLLESQLRFAGILDTAREAIISVDEQYNIVLFNKGAEQTFGYLASEMIGRPLSDILPKQFLEYYQQYLKENSANVQDPLSLDGRLELTGQRKNGQSFPASASFSNLRMDDRQLFTIVVRDVTERKQSESEREQRIIELRELNDSVRAITAELSLEQVLQKVTHAAKKLARVRYAALGLHDGQGRLSRFITAGIDASHHEKIGPLPVGHGLLGHLLYQGESMIVKKIDEHPSYAGFPENHPKMDDLLGVPVFSKNKLIGALYLADKIDGSDFSEADRQLVEMLAVHAAIAIENARLYGQTQRLAVLEERERFARDLHDGIIQSIYAVGLALDQAKMDIQPSNYAAREQIEISLKSLASVIKDIRNYIFDLRPQALRYRGLRARLDGLIKELRVNTLLPITAEIDPDIDSYLSDMQARHIFHITHEALSNAARHAKASRISLKVLNSEDDIKVIVEDDGIGFALDDKHQLKPGHHGLDNMLTRAAELNAHLAAKPMRQGTQLTLTLPKRVLGNGPKDYYSGNNAGMYA